MCTRWNLEHTTKWCTPNQESFQGYETHQIIWDLEIQKDPLILARRLGLVLIFDKEEKKRNRELVVLGNLHLQLEIRKEN